jgi:GAF domain-containing protein
VSKGRKRASSGAARRPRRRAASGAAAPRASDSGKTTIARLKRELADARRRLNEALDQQTASSEVLQVIASSPGELVPVFEAMLANATRLCAATSGTLAICEDDAFRIVATHNVTPAFAELRRREPVIRPGPTSSLLRSARTKQAVQIPNIMADAGYAQRDPLRAVAELGGARSALSVPLLKESTLIGVFNIYREQPGSFSDKHVELVANFANQAVIAIENARLLNELRQRTADLSEALEQQRATAEILSVISSLPADAQPVFDTIVRNFTQLCGGVFGAIYTFDGELVHFAGAHGFTPEQREAVRARYPVAVEDRSVIASRAVRTRAPVHIQDVLADPDYDRAYSSVGSWRRMLAVPMLREGVPLGAIVASWAEPGATPKQHEDLLKVFAAQAVSPSRTCGCSTSCASAPAI